MPSLFSGINVALRSLMAQQEAMVVVEHNVANANTPGYHRQEAIFSANIPSSQAMTFGGGSVGQFGTGVMVEKIQRFSQNFMDVRYREAISDSARWTLQSEILGQVEGALAETSKDGLTTKLDEFWNSWQALSGDPTNSSLKASVLADAQALASAINSRSGSLLQLRYDQNLTFKQGADEINDIASQIATLNEQISHSLAVNQQPNDLLDQRDQYLDRLSELTGALSFPQENGEVIVSINGHVLVNGNETFKLVIDGSQPMAAVKWEDGQNFTASTGELAALQSVRDGSIVNMIDALDNLAYNLVQAVNQIHNPDPATLPSDPPYAAAGMDFFQPLATVQGAAGSLRVNPAMETLSNIMGASAAYPGNGDIATSIANLRSATQASLDGLSFNSFYTSSVASLALETKNAAEYASNSKNVASTIKTSRESYSGVSLDEEAANLVKIQRAYQAAARMVNAMDEMLDTIINGMGLVGR